MKKVRNVLFGFIFICLTIIICIYAYAFFNKLSLDEQRKNITIYDVNQKVMFESNFKKNMTWNNLKDIPKFVQDAFVSVEDKRFYYHAGFDPIRIAKALGTNFIHGNIQQGGSTITQQYAKNLFLTNDQTISRKVNEFFYAARLEMQYSKDEILEGYLNTLYFGHGIYGVHAAADYFFDKKLSELSISETAMLIGIPNGPSIYSPFLHPDNATKRGHLILDVLENNGLITSAEKKEAYQEPLKLSKNDKVQEAGIDRYYIDAVIQELSKLHVDLTREVHVYTYYDPDVQKDLSNAVIKNVNLKDELEVAGIVTQPFSGNVMAMVGGKDYTLSQYNRAIYSSRQVASTIKPLLYYCALQQGFTPANKFSSQPTTFKISDDEEYTPSNYNHKYPNKEISMINAIAMSDNIYAVKTHLFLGTETLHSALKSFGITQAKQNPSEALGTDNMSILELSRIYNTFASEGLYVKPALISHITSGKKVNYKREVVPKRLLERDETLVLNQMLTGTFDLKNKTYGFPSMYGSNPNVQVAAKSGTSDWDSLVVGYNPEYTIGVWSGYDDNRKLTEDYYSITKNIFKDTFNSLYKTRKGIWYQPSDNIVEKKINPVTAQPDSNGSTYWFIKE